METGNTGQTKRLARRRQMEEIPVEDEVVIRPRDERLSAGEQRKAQVALVVGGLIFAGSLVTYAVLTIPELIG